MLKEFHYDKQMRWPKGERAAVFLTFDFQGGEDVKPDKNGILNYESWSQGEYGPHHAIYRLLRILKEENVKATFITCGAIAERFPEAVQAILDHGHPVEGHGYNHEIARYVPRDQEDDIMKRAIAMIKKRTGTAADRLALVHAEHQHHRVADRERLHLQHQLLPRGAAVPLGEERQGDGRAAAPAVRRRHAVRPPPRRVRQSVLRARGAGRPTSTSCGRSSATSPKYIPFTCHPYIIGRPGRTLALRGIIQHMKKIGRRQGLVRDGTRAVRLVPEQRVQGRVQGHPPGRGAQARRLSSRLPSRRRRDRIGVRP